MVKKNTINFLKKRSINNKDLKFGFNFIIIPENIEQLLKIPKLINEINHQTGEKNGVNFLTLRMIIKVLLVVRKMSIHKENIVFQKK